MLFFRGHCVRCFFRPEFRYCLSHFQNEKVAKNFAGENSQMDGVNMLDVLQKEMTELLEQNIRKIRINHQEEIKKVEGKFERKIEKIREEYEEKLQRCSAPTSPTIPTTTNGPHTNAVKGR